MLTAPARLVRPASDEFRRAGLALLEAMPPGSGRLILELSGTDEADSVGLAALITMRRRARAKGLGVVLRGVTPAFRELLRMAKLETQFEIDQ